MGFGVVAIGFAFATPTLTMILTSPLVFYLTKFYKKKSILWVGILLLTASMILIGPSGVL
jgi:hypothetical protein